MSSAIAVAMIGAAGVILAAALPVVISAIIEYRSKYLSSRRKAFLGRWEGEGSDFYVEDPSKPRKRITLTITFTAVKRTVKAHGVLRGAGSTEGDELSLRGIFYNENYVQLSWHNKRPEKIQMGVVVVGLSPDGLIQRGYYAGFSPERATIVAGAVRLEKKP
jgi:hypothetical protein